MLEDSVSLVTLEVAAPSRLGVSTIRARSFQLPGYGLRPTWPKQVSVQKAFLIVETSISRSLIAFGGNLTKCQCGRL